jgi:hypothetical protein
LTFLAFQHQQGFRFAKCRLAVGPFYDALTPVRLLLTALRAWLRFYRQRG